MLEEADERARFWQAITTADHQPAPEAAAPLIVVPLACKTAYLDRYAEPTRAGPTGMRPIGRSPTGTSIPALLPCSCCSPRSMRLWEG